MPKKRTTSIPGYIILIILVLSVLIIYLNIRINRLNDELNSIIVIDWQGDNISINRGNASRLPLITVTAEFVNQGFSSKSPFNDGKSFSELVNDYVKYGRSDMYGNPRRTGEIRRIHEGVDLYVPEDTPVYPLFSIGIVTEVSDDPDFMFKTIGYRGDTRIDSVGVEYGKIVRILYPEGVESVYAHLNEVLVEEGQIVGPDTKVGLTGYTGNIRNSGKPSHLHVELRDRNNYSFDPEHRLYSNNYAMDLFLERLFISLNDRENNDVKLLER